MNNEELIIAYFNNTLSREERSRVEALLPEDKAFKNEFEEYRDVRAAFKIHEAKELKSQLKALESKTSNSALKLSAVIKYAIAAVVIAVIGFSFFFNSNTQSIFKEYYQTYPNVYKPVVRGNSDSQKDNAFRYYENKDYVKAQQEFEAILNTQYNPNIAFYYGLALLETNNFKAALMQFEAIIGTEDFQYTEELLWYSALAYIKTKSYEKARKQLEKLKANPASDYYRDAADILSELPKN